MNRILAVLVVAAWVAAPALASERTEVMAPVHQFVDGFNKGDAKMALAACADQASIIDEFPPHEWHGTGACATWAKDFEADARKNGVTDGVVTIGSPRRVDITGDRAYVVVPAAYAYKVRGKPVSEKGATMTVALQKAAAGWRITGWAWTKR